MFDTDLQSLSVRLAHRAEAFEAALARDAAVDFREFLPPTKSPLYLATLLELVRIDLEFSWTRNSPKRISEYLSRFPALLENAAVLSAIAFEEYRQRRISGEAVTAGEYQLLYAIDTSDWPIVPSATSAESESDADQTARVCIEATPAPIGDRHLSPGVLAYSRNEDPADAEAMQRLHEAARSMPKSGTEFLGFRLVNEIGRGAFGRVYLAQQGDLAGRFVVLKVACDIAAESNTLAQLQHANIVPIYSFHRAGPYQAVCMPFFGQTTLAQVLESFRGAGSLPNTGNELRSAITALLPDSRSASGSSSSGKSNVPSHRSDLRSSQGLVQASNAASHARIFAEGWARLDGLSYVEAILTLGSQLADGLSHAHARGILHRDLKPANVLFTDEGRPMLLDFNLAEDTKVRGMAERAAIGGTLQYMAPEHLEAFRASHGDLDERCDIFSLGVILFELLTGRHPFPSHKGPMAERIRAMAADRRLPPPLLRSWNPAISYAAESIIRKCLEADPNRRYRQAAELREDIDLHLTNQPLKYATNPSIRERMLKWVRRHPRLSSSGTVMAVSAAILLAVGAGAFFVYDRNRDLSARTLYLDHQAAFANAQLLFDDRNQSHADLSAAQANLRGVLDRYGVPVDGKSDDWLAASPLRRLPPADRERCQVDIGETFYLMSQLAQLQAEAADDPAERASHMLDAENWNAAAARYSANRLPRAIAEQSASLAEWRHDAQQSRELHAKAVQEQNDSPRDNYLVGTLLFQKGRHQEAIPYLQKSTSLDPKNFSAWFVRGTAHLAVDQPDQAAMCFGACLAIRDDFAPAWLDRGQAFIKLHFYDQARDDFDRSLQLNPQSVKALILRSEAKSGLHDLKGAEEDLSQAIAMGGVPVRVYFLRADLRDRRKNPAGAEADREFGLQLTPKDELSWVSRAEIRSDKNPLGALADVEAALKLNPFSAQALQMKAHILGEQLHRDADALAVLDRGIRLHPEYPPLLAGRGVLLARQGKRIEAHQDAKAAYRLDTRPPNAYQIACIYALTSRTHPEDKAQAYRLLWSAVKTGFGLEFLATDSDLDPIRKENEFLQLVKDANIIQKARKP